MTLHAFNPSLTAESRWVGLKILIVGGWDYLLQGRWGRPLMWGSGVCILSFIAVPVCEPVSECCTSLLCRGGAESTPMHDYIES